MSEKKVETKPRTGGFLGWVERIGNKIPHPFILFLGLIVIVWIASAICSSLGTSVTNPVDGKEVYVKNLLSGDGIVWMLQNAVKNFVSFAPLGLVLTMTLGIGFAEHIGLISTFMKKTMLGASPKLVTFIIMIIGIVGNIASDAAIVIVPTISAAIFASMGRHPLAGIAIGYASTTAGFSANLFIAGTDALLAGISTESIHIVNESLSVTPVDNWFFMIASTFVLAFVGVLISEKIIEPRLGTYTGTHNIDNKDVTPEESKALKKSGIAALIYIGIIVIATIPQNSFFRNPKTHGLVPSPLISSIIPILLFLFVIMAYVYGKSTKQIKNFADVPGYMAIAIKDMSSYIVLIFVIGQFIAQFNWSNLGYAIAVNGADALKASNITGIPLFILFILFVAFVNLFMGSGSAKWSLLAPIFIPMFYLLGYNPAFTQLLYRLGDSTTNIISPLFPYFPIILALTNEYDEKAGVGTVLSLMIPYSLIILVVWIVFLILYTQLGLPIGPGISGTGL